MGSTRNMAVRVVADASGFSDAMKKAGAAAESTGKRIKKSLSQDNLSSQVGSIMGWGNSGTDIGEISAHNFAAAQQQLETLRAYREELSGLGFGSMNDSFAEISGRIRELEYDLDAYSNSLLEAAEAEQEVSENAFQTKDAFEGAEKSATRASRSFQSIGSSAKLSTPSVEKLLRSIRNISVASFGFRVARSLFGEFQTLVKNYISQDAQLQAQVNGLSASLSQSLAPAIHLVTGALSHVLPYVAGVRNAIGSLIGSVWGTAAARANKTAAATSNAAKAQKEMNRQLFSFDQINRAESRKDTSTETAVTPLEAKTPAWAERFRATFSELFNSEEFQSANIGGKIGMAIQTGIDWLSSEAQSFDWSGTSAKLRNNFSSMISQIDWGGALQLIGKGFGFVIGTGVGFLVDTFRKPWNDFREQLKKDTEMLGGDAVAGFFFGIGRMIGNIGSWLWDNFCKPIIDGVKAGLGIHSPSTVFASIGENCMEGLLECFNKKISSVLQKLSDLRDRIVAIANKVKDAFSFDWQMPSLRLPHLQIDWEPASNAIAKFFGVTAIPRMSVQWFAKGGILDGAQLFGRMGSTLLGGGERGREAILPLDTNTGWMDVLAHRIAQTISTEGGDVNATIKVVLDGEVLTTTVMKGLRSRARAGTSSF